MTNVVMQMTRQGEQLSCGTGHPDYGIVSVEGLTALELEIQSESNPYVAGATVTNVKPLTRQIELVLACRKELREQAIAFFNPLMGGRLVVTWNGVTRWIEYIAHPVKVQQRTVHQDALLRVRLLCPDPYFRHLSDYGQDITFRQALLAYPLVIQGAVGVVGSYRIPRNEVTLCNAGHVPVGIRVLFQALGDVENPRIALGDGRRFVRVITPLRAGDALEISTDVKDIYARLNGESVLHKIDRASEFFQLPLGDSLLSYEAGQDFDKLSVTVFFTPRYLGV